MKRSAQLLSHDVQRRIADSFARGDERSGRNDDREDGHQLPAASNAVVNADAPASCVLDLSDLADEKLRHAKCVESVAASHDGNTPLSNDEDHLTPHETVINIIDAPAKIRFCGASCVVLEHSTLGATAHRVVAALSSPTRPNHRTHERERSQRHHDSSYAPHAVYLSVEGRVG